VGRRRVLALAAAARRRHSERGRTAAGTVNLRELLARASARIGGDAARLEAELLLAHMLGVSRAKLYAWPELVPDADSRARFERAIEARAAGEPVAYLLGHREFWKLDLSVSPAVLIPRPETERLVELALERIAPDRAVRIADLGTGSGAIALAIASERPRARVLATDASADALVVARANAERLAVRNVTFAQGDWCDALGALRFDVIVSNPPYIAEGDPHLDAGDLPREPRSALASGVDGLDAIRRIVACAPAQLDPGGWLLLEHGWEQASHVRALLVGAGFVAVESARDDAGHERVSLGRTRV
jgi:release factor glutamine methyltransferase